MLLRCLPHLIEQAYTLRLEEYSLNQNMRTIIKGTEKERGKTEEADKPGRSCFDIICKVVYSREDQYSCSHDPCGQIQEIFVSLF